MTILHNSMRLLLNQEAVSVKDCMKEFATLVAFHRPGAQKLSPEKSSFIKTMIVVMMLAVLLITTASPVLANAPSELSSAATTLKFTAVADAQVTRKYPNRNYGASAELGVAGGSSAASSAYIRFDVSNISGVVQSAVLRIYCKARGTKNGPALYLGADNNWIESGRGGITWKKQPALSGEAYDNKAVISRRSWVQYNVTGLVNGNGTYTFALVADSRDSVTFSSRESSKPPQLVLEISSDPSATLTPPVIETTTIATDAPTSIPTSTLLTPTTVGADTTTPTATLLPTSTVSSTSTPIVLPSPTLTDVPATGSSNFPVGWWLEQTSPLSSVGTYATSGERLFLLDGGYCGVDQLPTFKKFLTEAAKYNNKVILKLNCLDNTTQGVSDADMTTTINSLKSYPALWAWSTADEPEFDDDAAVRQRRHDRLLYSYNMIKRLDASHPIFISFDFNGFNFGYAAQFYDVADIIGIHAYPYFYNTGILSSGEMYDLWSAARTWANGKPFIATMQGFGNGVSPYRSPTLAESRFQTFSAMVQGVPNILFWMNEWSDRSGDSANVVKVMSEVQAIGAEMQNGITNDPGISVSITDHNRLVYRFGTSNTRAVILAVNIANRGTGGTTLSNVTFTVPAGYSNVQVLDENRVLPINNNTFTDSFTKFEVHVYLLTP